MKTILRNFLSVMRRFKMATTLNILGLSVAFAAFMVILMQLDFEYNFDKMYADSEKIYRVEIDYKGTMIPLTSRPMGNTLIQSSPHILAGALCDAIEAERSFITVEHNGERHSFQEQATRIDPSFTDVFPFEMSEGVAKAMADPKQVIIPQSMAQKFFGGESAVGKTLEVIGSTFFIGGVYKDFPKNSLVQNAIYRRIPEQENIQNGGNLNYNFFIRLDSPETAKHLAEDFAKTINSQLTEEDAIWWDDEVTFGLTQLPDIHYTVNVQFDPTPKASYQILWVLLSIAIIILVIAGINFTNFSTALTPMRIKSINTQKVLGGTEAAIRLSLLVEAITISVVSFLIALGMVHTLQFTEVTTLIDADIALAGHPLIIGGTALLALVTGLLAGLYPSYYMTSFPPALVLKGSFGLSPKGRKLRNVLISVQFISSFALIIGASFMYLQNRYMQHTPLGYDKNALIITDINEKVMKSTDAFATQVKNFSGVENVTFAEQLLSSGDQYMSWGRKYEGRDIQFNCLPVDPSFLDVLGISATDGRSFRQDDKLKKNPSLVFNERARSEYDLKLGSTVQDMEIIGFIPDIKFASFRTEVMPMAFLVWGSEGWGKPDPTHAYIKVKAGSDMHAAMNHVKASLTAIDADYPFDVRFYDQILNTLYEKEQSLTMLITLFSLIAIFISIVGVFGLVVFDSEYRRKEIGLRKVMGSTTEEILILFNKTYVRILCYCFILAAPLAYYSITTWLENFAYKTPIYWWVFLASFVIVSLITILTVTFQNYWTANENPVKSIKME